MANYDQESKNIHTKNVCSFFLFPFSFPENRRYAWWEGEKKDKFVCPSATWMEWIMKFNIADMNGTRCVCEWIRSTGTEKNTQRFTDFVVFLAIRLIFLQKNGWWRQNKIHRLDSLNLSYSGLYSLHSTSGERNNFLFSHEIYHI